MEISKEKLEECFYAGTNYNQPYNEDNTKESAFDEWYSKLITLKPIEVEKEATKGHFKQGDKVFHISYGWGRVSFNASSDGYLYVYFKMLNKIRFRKGSVEIKLLSFTEYKLEGISQESPEPAIERDALVYYKFRRNTEWEMGYYSQYDGRRHYVFSDQSNSEAEKNQKSVFSISLTNPLIEEK